jgi:polygalacturonase
MRIIEISATADVATEKLQKTMDDLGEAGGGVIRLMPGIHQSGMLRLRSNITLEIPSGAVLQA